MKEIRPLVLIPTYNEAENVVPLIDRILALPSQFDVLIVDDSSPDGTSELVKMRSTRDPDRVHLVQRAVKNGLGKAYIAGLDWGLARSYKIICHMDADFSHSPEDLERLIAALQSSDLVLGVRYAKGGGVRGWPIHRQILSRGANFLARTMIGTNLSDLTGGFKAYRRETLEALDLSRVQSAGYTFEIETTVRVLHAGLKVGEVPIIFQERERGKSKIASFSTTLQTLRLISGYLVDRMCKCNMRKCLF